MTDERPDETAPVPTLVELGPEECLALLRSVPVGRIGFVTEDGRPMVLPVNHVVVDSDVAFRTTRGTKLDFARRMAGAAAVYEVDDFDAGSREGWSVVAHGVIEPVVEATAVARLERLGHHVWTDDVERSSWVYLRVDELTGRKIDTRGEPR